MAAAIIASRLVGGHPGAGLPCCDHIAREMSGVTATVRVWTMGLTAGDGVKRSELRGRTYSDGGA